MTICPCCGSKSTFGLTDGCSACGARPVGEPLPRPEVELPSYGRSLLLFVIGGLMVLGLLIPTIVSLVGRLSFANGILAGASGALSFWTWVAAGQTAAWQLKWAAIPATIFVFWGARKVYRSVQQSPDRFCGFRHARRGYFAAAAVPLLIAVLIGVTVPERLYQRQLSIDAGFNAQAYRIDRALAEYREEFGTLPSDLKDLERLPDRDRSLAEALQNLDISGYKPSAELAAAPKKKPQPLRGGVILNASSPTDEPLTESLSFTNYELRLPGADKLLGTPDDLILRDGVITKASETPRRLGDTTIPSQAVNQ